MNATIATNYDKLVISGDTVSVSALSHAQSIGTTMIVM